MAIRSDRRVNERMERRVYEHTEERIIESAFPLDLLKTKKRESEDL